MAAPDFDGCVRWLGPPGAPAAFEPAPRRRAIFDLPRSTSRDEHGSGANGASGSGHFDASRGDNIILCRVHPRYQKSSRTVKHTSRRLPIDLSSAQLRTADPTLRAASASRVRSTWATLQGFPLAAAGALVTRLHLKGIPIAHCGSRARRDPRPARCGGP